jgi:hypothetical protein
MQDVAGQLSVPGKVSHVEVNLCLDFCLFAQISGVVVCWRLSQARERRLRPALNASCVAGRHDRIVSMSRVGVLAGSA